MPGNDFAPADFNIKAGYLDRKITIQQPSDSADGEGGTVRTWTTYVTTFASIQPFKGMEIFSADQVFSEQWVRMLIRYRPSQPISTAMRVQYGSKVYEIRQAYDKAAQRRMVEMLCQELRTTGSNQ
jgi:SPP1 family predicted phage head-tail adaptor